MNHTVETGKSLVAFGCLWMIAAPFVLAAIMMLVLLYGIITGSA